jgi:BlaI family penicillinase repressor
MPKSKVYRLGDLQLRIMKVLWRRTEAATVAEVHEALSEEGALAYTTIATMLRKMEARGLVRHRLHERKFLYRAAVQAEEITRKISAHFIERLFEGSLADMLAHLLTTQEISREELVRLEELIATRKKKL